MNIENYPEFLSYARCKETGLRKEALKHLEVFLSAIKDWSSVEQRAFIRALFDEQPLAELPDLLTFPLVSQLLFPALQNWCMENPNDFFPYFAFAFILKWPPRLSSEQWKQLEDDAAVTAGRRALELSPKHIPSIELCARILLEKLMAIWHDTYSGFPEVQFPHKELEEARHYITQLPDSPVKTELSAELSFLQQSFENWPEK